MSHDIVYDRKFFKTTRGYIPCLLLANSDDPIKYGRDRNWVLLNNNPNEMTAKECEQFAKTYYYAIGASLKFRNKFMDADEFVKFMELGVKNARTVEEYLRVKKNPIVEIWVRSPEPDKYGDQFKSSYQRLVSTEQLEAIIDSLNEMLQEAPSDLKICIRIGFSSKRSFPTPPSSAEKSAVNNYEYAAKINRVYINKVFYDENRNVRCYTTDPLPCRAKRFKSANEVIDLFRDVDPAIRPVACRGKRFKQPPEYVLFAVGPMSFMGNMVESVDSESVYLTDTVETARGYYTVQEAEKAVQRIKKAGSSLDLEIAEIQRIVKDRKGELSRLIKLRSLKQALDKAEQALETCKKVYKDNTAVYRTVQIDLLIKKIDYHETKGEHKKAEEFRQQLQSIFDQDT